MALPVRPPVQRMTEAEYLALGDLKPYREYLDGIVVEKVMGNGDHIDLAEELLFHLGIYRRRVGGRAGPEGRVRFVDGTHVFHRLPDVAYWGPDRDRGPKDAMNPPTLAIEIRSPGESMRAQREKCAMMHALGVDVCWLVDPPSRTVETYDADTTRTLRAGDVLQSPALPGFSLAIDDLFSVIE